MSSAVLCTVCTCRSLSGEKQPRHPDGHLSSVSFTEYDNDKAVHYQEGTMATKRAKSTKTHAGQTHSPSTGALAEQVQSGTPLDTTTRDTEGRTPLHLAAFFGYLAIVRNLLLQQADVEARDNCERTPGHWSAYKGHLDVIKLLVESGADVNARDAGGRTWLRMALIGRQPAVEALLRVHGAVL